MHAYEVHPPVRQRRRSRKWYRRLRHWIFAEDQLAVRSVPLITVVLVLFAVLLALAIARAGW